MMYHLSATMMAVRGVQSGDGDAGLIGTLAVEDAVAAWTDGPQRFRRHGLQPRLRALCLYQDRPLAVVSWTSLITTGTQTTGADYVVRDAGPSSWQAARQRSVLILRDQDRRLGSETRERARLASKGSRSFTSLLRLRVET